VRRGDFKNDQRRNKLGGGRFGGFQSHRVRRGDFKVSGFFWRRFFILPFQSHRVRSGDFKGPPPSDDGGGDHRGGFNLIE